MKGSVGAIDIRLQNAKLQQVDLPSEDMHPGDYLLVSITDTGCGMDEAIQKRIFEPFFTNKPAGEGTGLGLSVAYGVVKSHRGDITCISEPGKGSVFCVYLPRVDTEASEIAESVAPIRGGNERILVVDDEETIVESIRNMLQRYGYQVTALADSRTALSLFKEDPSLFDLVITDQTMPFITGESLGRELMHLRPDIPVILCTGYSDSISSEKAMAIGFRGFIAKPFTLKNGLEIMRRVLDQTRSDASR
jgi:CheY-like chemotaxis protein